MVHIEPCALLKGLALIASLLKKRRFYAHFVDGDIMYVVFPSTISIVRRGYLDDQESCLTIAKSVDVPFAQLPFERMFEFGHAERL